MQPPLRYNSLPNLMQVCCITVWAILFSWTSSHATAQVNRLQDSSNQLRPAAQGDSAAGSLQPIAPKNFTPPPFKAQFNEPVSTKPAEDPWIAGRNQNAPPPQSTIQVPIRQPQAYRPDRNNRVDGVQTATWNQPISASDVSLGSSESVQTQNANYLASTSSTNFSESNEIASNPSGSAKQKIPLRPPSTKATGSIEAPASSWSSLVSMFASLMVVIGLFLGAAWMLRKTTTSGTNTLPKEVVQVLGRCTMAPRQQLYLLRFGQRLVLVTHQPGQTDTISEIDDPLEVDRIAGICEQNSNGSVSQSFRQVLHSVSSGRNVPAKRGVLS